MECEKCGRDINRDFNYCPRCGTRIRKGFFSLFQSLFDRNRLEKPPGKTELPFIDFPKMGGITIKVTGPKGTKVSRIPFNRTSRAERIPMKTETAPKPQPEMHEESEPPKELVEPEASLNRRGENFILKFKLPDIKNSRDINIMKFPNSLELRARVKDKMYFKLMKLPKKLSITNQTFEKGVLTVELS